MRSVEAREACSNQGKTVGHASPQVGKLSHPAGRRFCSHGLGSRSLLHRFSGRRRLQ